jgi:hypothetical protein
VYENKIFVILAVMIPVMVISTMNTFVYPVSACETNANGCVKNGGPGASGHNPAEVSGCHNLPLTDDCAKELAPGLNK